MAKNKAKKERLEDDDVKSAIKQKPAKRSDFKIDRNHLDDEWERQSELALEYNEQLADAKLELEDAEQALSVKVADLKRAIRDDPDSYGIAKGTEDEIKATVPRIPSYQKALKNVNIAKHRVGMLAAACVAMEHKKRALTLFVELHGRGYFADAKGKKRAKTSYTRDELEEDDD